MAYPTIAAASTKSAPIASAPTSYPSFNTGAVNMNALSNSGNGGGYPTLSGGNSMANASAANPSMNQGGTYP
eukprot:CAMPEP_0116878090 /NCGR_PEP_ID=MMETSP0463-20121206/9833_1 /TAXON_ID=181622 /ORGANISM="Strombidinopsis sp, Strain SopsisLIS2011" /LENGTH=71 /DNA_ID=CAMNT_0004525949 /DNA_START=469 /DNA_END=684 /DNA_ORIENTATION=+